MMPENEQKSPKRANALNKDRERRNTFKKGAGKHKASLFLIVLIFLIGLSVLLYPNISEYFNSRNSSRAVANYESDLAKTSENERQAMLRAARAYNQDLLTNDTRFEEMSAAESERYNSTLNINGEGMMCYMEIPSLGVSLPVYHTTEEIVLQRYIGHVEGSSLPVGGPGTHAVLSGHRGLPSAELFTNLDRMEEGDLFQIHVLGEVLTYQVDDRSVVLPEEVTQLTIDLEQDWVTLVTCTPYGVNTHRLLVRGTRIETPEDLETVMEEAVMFTKLNISLWIAIGMGVLFLIVLLLLWLSNRKKKEAGPAKKKKRKKRSAGDGKGKAAAEPALKPAAGKEEPKPAPKPETKQQEPAPPAMQEGAHKNLPEEWEAALQSAMHAQVEIIRNRMETISEKEEAIRNHMETISAQEEALSAREEAVAAREAAVSAKEAFLRELISQKPEKDDA